METTQSLSHCGLSRRTQSDDERTLSLDRPGDTLAMVRRTFGSLPRDSLVVLGLQEGSTGGQMRVDLPPAEHDAVSYARRVAECIAGQDARPRPCAVVLLLLTEEEPEPSWEQDPAGRPWAALMEALCLIFDVEYGVAAPKVWVVGGDRMRDYECLESSCCPYPGREVSALLEEAEARHPWLGAAGGPGEGEQCGSPAERVQGFESGGLRGAEFLRAVSDHGAELARRRAQGGAEVHELLVQWDSALEITVETGDAAWLAARPETAAALVAVCATPALRDTLIPLASVGFAAALCGHLGHRAAAEVDDDPVRAAQLLRDRHGEQLPAGLDLPEDLEAVMTEYRHSFLGRTGRRPDWLRIDALAQLLGALTGSADGEALTHLMSLMAWIEWARGRGSCAGAFVDRCREIAPESELARLIEQYMALGGICPWARVKVHSWSWWHRGAGQGPVQRAAEKIEKLCETGNEQGGVAC